MSIKIKAIERKLMFEKGENAPFEYRYVLQADLYSKLSDQKVIQEAPSARASTRALSMRHGMPSVRSSRRGQLRATR